MADMRRLALYAHTIRHMKPRQIAGRVGMRIIRPSPDISAAPAVRELHAGAWREPARLAPSMTGPVRFRFLNEIRDLDEIGWDDPQTPLLWRYNLHYFDDLVAQNAKSRTFWHVPLILRWIAQNPPGQGTGRDPYPTSLRIVNWIMWALGGNELPAEAIHSLAVQTRWLMRRLEWHLLGNHLFANAKALVFAGLFFAGDEAERWLQKGLSIFAREIPEQILPDGGHFELSPMYHAIILKDMFDLINILNCVPAGQRNVMAPLRAAAESRLPGMLGWLSVMTHPDGEIAFFNDAAFGIAPRPEEIHAYGKRLGIAADLKGDVQGIIHLRDSGYIRINSGPVCLFLDVGRVGPDYIPGHAHADTLSFELSFSGQRVIVNSGISQYGDGPRRLYQRSTAAHNTVEIDDENSSEVWDSFRVARRARPVDLSIVETGDEVLVSCAHDGYQRLVGQVTHRRLWRFAGRSLEIVDRIEGETRKAVVRFHFHPTVRPVLKEKAGRLEMPGGEKMEWRIEGGDCALMKSEYYPEFGISVSTHCLVIAPVSSHSRFMLSW